MIEMWPVQGVTAGAGDNTGGAATNTGDPSVSAATVMLSVPVSGSILWTIVSSAASSQLLLHGKCPRAPLLIY